MAALSQIEMLVAAAEAEVDNSLLFHNIEVAAKGIEEVVVVHKYNAQIAEDTSMFIQSTR